MKQQPYNKIVIKTTLWTFILFLGMFIILYGCESNPKKHVVAFDNPLYNWGTVSGQTITIRGNQDDLHRPYMLKTFERYHALTGNTVLLEGLTHKELGANLPAAFLAGSAERPDILLSPGGTAIENLNPDTNFYDFTNAPWVNDLTDTAINQTIHNAKIIGLPYWEASVSGILYNKELFKRLKINVPRTQEEFLAVCETLLQQGITPVYLPYAEPTMMLYQFPMDSIVFNARNLNGLNMGTLSYSQIPEMEKIVAWYKTMSDRGYFGREYTKNNWAGMDGAMRHGQYAMMICWDTWLYTHFTGDPSKFGLMPTFMGVPESGSFEGPNLMLLLVNKNSPRLEAALDLILFMADPYNYNVALEGLYTAPVFKNQVGSISTPQYMESEQQIENLLYDSTAWQRIKGFSQVDAVFIQSHMQDSTYTVQDCLRDMDAARRKRIKEDKQIGEH